MRLTVLYDAGCPLCRRFRDWLAGQPTLVPLDLVAAGSVEARQRFPGLDHARTLAEITVVADDGRLWTREHAWVVAMWATASYRPLSLRLSGPAGLPVARLAAMTAAGLRSALTSTPDGDAYSDHCAGTCHPLPQG